jgi:hypothetical protein
MAERIMPEARFHRILSVRVRSRDRAKPFSRHDSFRVSDPASKSENDMALIAGSWLLATYIPESPFSRREQPSVSHIATFYQVTKEHISEWAFPVAVATSVTIGYATNLEMASR